jgi:putative hydrolase of HD superfamily
VKVTDRDIPIAKIVELSQLCLQFARVNRVTYHEDGKRFESDADHTVMLGIVACAFAEQFEPNLDRGLIAQYALVHDFVEVYAGDTCTINATGEQFVDKAAREAAALDKLRAQFSGIFPWLIATIESYDTLASPEARFIKTLDKVLPKITHALNKGAALIDHGIAFDDIDSINAQQLLKIGLSYGHDQIEAMRLYTGIHEYLIAELTK